MTTDPLHIPTPEFRAQLEWEVVRAERRASRLGAMRSEQHRRRLRISGLVAVCVAIGSASGFASAQVGEGARRDSLVDAARAELAMLSLRLELAKTQLQDADRKFRVGAIASERLAAAEVELRSLQVRMLKNQLNIEEIRLAKLAPRDELNAPLVSGRDFVMERLQLDISNAQQRVEAAERASQEAERRLRVGATPEQAVVESRLAATEARAALVVAGERFVLRREFLDRGTATDQLVRRLEAAQLRADLMVAQQSMELARLRVSTAERQRQAGVATELDLLRAQVEMKERELELSQLAARLRRLGEVRRDSVP